ncbi:MAG: methionine gamma-lyase [bacterium]|nr:methionine gamma-lyase [bacterium]
MTPRRSGFATRQIHKGGHPDPHTGSLTMPIFQTSTFVMHDAQHGADLFTHAAQGYIYTRLGNPNHVVVEQKVADLENGEAAVATASGMAAISAALWTLLQAGDHIVTGRVLYGCTFALLHHTMSRFGVETSFVDATDPENVRAAIRPNTRLVLLETPSNPSLEITDIAAVCDIAHQHGVLVMVDNTFCTPYLQLPLDLGADLVVHSATKYLNGHGDVIAGFLIGPEEIITRVREVGLKDATGAVLGPFEAFLTLRGMKTLSCRMDAHCRNAQTVAEYLNEHDLVEKVIFPGLPCHPQYDLARRQMKGPGGMVSFEVKGGHDAGVAVIDHVKLISIAVSLGDIESLIEHPASMTHSTYTEEEREIAGISDGLVRISVGLEDPEDIIRDLDQALEAARKMVLVEAQPA